MGAVYETWSSLSENGIIAMNFALKHTKVNNEIFGAVLVFAFACISYAFCYHSMIFGNAINSNKPVISMSPGLSTGM